MFRFRPNINKNSIKFLRNMSTKQPDNNNNYDIGDILIACGLSIIINDQIKNQIKKK